MQLNYTACNRSVQEATPEDIMVYFTQHWLPAHAGSITTEGEHIAAPGSLSSTKSHLSSEFELLGCTGDWNPISQTGNPMLSVQIRNMLKGYSNHANQLGYQKKGAVPLTESKMQRLLAQHGQYLQQQQHRPTPALATLTRWHAVQSAIAVLFQRFECRSCETGEFVAASW